MQKIFFIAFSALLFFSACSSEKTPAEKETPILSENTDQESDTQATAVQVANDTENQEASLTEEAIQVTENSEETPAPKEAESEENVVSTSKKATEQKASKVAEKVSSKVEAKKEKVAQKVEEKVNTPPKAVEKVIETIDEEEEAPAVADLTPMAPVPSHDAWDALLRKYVSSSGKVNYAGFKGEKAKLEAYLKTLQDNPPADGDWSRKEKLAYWINVYNAFTVKLIVDNYPTSSITNLEGGKPWDKKWIKIGGKTYSLNNVENDIIRPRFNEPRIHFAVNCAAKSCPPLLNRAWTAANLSSNFEKQAKAFINNSNFNVISANNVKVSKIFEWYGEDFGNLINYLNKYSTTKINSSAKVDYLEYDWALNK